MSDQTASVQTGDGYESLKSYVLAATGLEYFRSQDELLLRAFHERMSAIGSEDHGVYLSQLLDPVLGEVELQRLVQLLTISETSFFRHAEVFGALARRILPNVLSTNQQSRSMRIWSAGCSIGAEPYSIAMTISRHFPEVAADWQVRILASDINAEYLAAARRGCYGDWILRNVAEGDRECLFERRNFEWCVREEYRRLVEFECHNLVHNAPPGSAGDLFDIVFCRNVMIYFSEEIMSDLVRRLAQVIRPGGWLVVGAAEATAPVFDAFETIVEDGAVVYHKRDMPAADVRVASVAAGERPLRSRVANRPLLQQVAGDTRRVPASALSVDRFDPHLHFALGQLKEQQGRLDEAESAYRRSLFLEPQLVCAQASLGRVLELRHRSTEASRLYREALEQLSRLAPGEIVEPQGQVPAEVLQQAVALLAAEGPR